MLCRESEGCLVHRVACAESEEEPFWILVGECGQGLGYDGRVASDEVRYCDSDSDPPGPGGYGGEGGEGFGGGRGLCPVEQMVVYEDTVEAVFLAELCSPDNFLERFSVGEEEPASESDRILHPSFRELSFFHLYYCLLDLCPMNPSMKASVGFSSPKGVYLESPFYGCSGESLICGEIVDFGGVC